MEKKNQFLGQAKHFPLGVVVALTSEYCKHFGSGVKFGHVVGFGLNEATSEVIIEVRFAGDKKSRELHPCHLTKV